MEAIETYELANGRKLCVYQDPEPDDPRNWDNAWHFLCAHRRYKLGDEQVNGPVDIDELREERGIALIHPLYLYDHSGISISLGREYPFNCPWDSGQVGIAYITTDALQREWNGDEAKALACLAAEVETYDQYLRGDVYGFRIIAAPRHCDACGHDETDETEDSCWGFYGSDPRTNGMADHLSDADRRALLGERVAASA